MPRVLFERGFTLMIHLNDHEPAHVHAYKAGGMVLINIRDLSVRKIIMLKKQDVKLATEIVAANRAVLLEKWEECHGS